MSQRYTDLREGPSALYITLTLEGREEQPKTLEDALEYHLCNGWSMIQPEEIGALTDAPIIGIDVQRDDQGKLIHVGRAFWFPNYMVEDPLKTLLKKGTVVFQETK